MKTRFPLLFAALLFAPGVLPAQSPANPYWDNAVKEAKSHIKEIAPADLEGLRKSEASLVVVDVREDNEWAEARAAGAVHVGRGVLERAIVSAVPQKETPVVLYCHSGGRSALAAETLGKMGYTRVLSLAGGFTAYEKAGLPIDRGHPAK